MSDYLGWVGNVILLAAVYMLGYRWRHAFLLTAIGETVWCVPAYLIGRYDMLFICAVFGAMAMRNWLMWADDQPEAVEAPHIEENA